METNAEMCRKDPVHPGNSSSRLKDVGCREERTEWNNKTKRKRKQPGKGDSRTPKKQTGKGPENLERKQTGKGSENLKRKQPRKAPEHFLPFGIKVTSKVYLLKRITQKKGKGAEKRHRDMWREEGTRKKEQWRRKFVALYLL